MGPRHGNMRYHRCLDTPTAQRISFWSRDCAHGPHGCGCGRASLQPQRFQKGDLMAQEQEPLEPQQGQWQLGEWARLQKRAQAQQRQQVQMHEQRQGQRQQSQMRKIQEQLGQGWALGQAPVR